MSTYGKMKRALLLLLLSPFLIFLFQTPTKAASFPGEEWDRSTPEEQGISPAGLVKMMNYLAEKSQPVDSIAIVRNGRLVFEAYFWPFAKGQRHKIHSCTKSIMSALIGIAIDQGHIKGVEEPVLSLLPGRTLANPDQGKGEMTLEDLLMMASGLKCRDSYRYLWAGLTEMRTSPDWVDYILGLPLEEPPGSRFEYCNGLTYLLSVILQDATKIRTLDFAKKNLFAPLGITDLLWRQSPQGYDIGYGGMWLKPLDMARFGLLYLNQGRWKDRQLVPRAWVEASTKARLKATLFSGYGYQWWVEEDYYAALGYKGQNIFVVPKKNMVVVFTSDMLGGGVMFPKEVLEKHILPAAESATPLPPDPASQKILEEMVAAAAVLPPQGFIWTSRKEGVAKDGTFVRTAAPGFSFNYPLGSRKLGLDYQGQIMRLKTAGDVELSAIIRDIPEGVELKDLAEKVILKELSQFGSDFQIQNHDQIRLGGGATAWRTDLKWVIKPGFPITTYLITAYRDGKCVILNSNSLYASSAFEEVAESLTFE